MKNIIKNKVVEAVKELYNFDIDISEVKVKLTSKQFNGDFTLIVQPLLKYSKKSLEQTEIEIGDYLMNNIKEILNYNCGNKIG